MKHPSYRCPSCGQAITHAQVLTISSGGSGRVEVEYVCACSPQPLKQKFRTNMRVLVGIMQAFPGVPRMLPWTSPLKPEAVADDDPRLVGWRWELAQVGSADEFIAFLDGHAP